LSNYSSIDKFSQILFNRHVADVKPLIDSGLGTFEAVVRARKAEKPAPAQTAPPGKLPEVPAQKPTALMPDAKAKEFLRGIYGGTLPEESFATTPAFPPLPEPEVVEAPAATTESTPTAEPTARPARRRKLAELRADEERGLSLPGSENETPAQPAKRIARTANTSVANLQRRVKGGGSSV